MDNMYLYSKKLSEIRCGILHQWRPADRQNLRHIERLRFTPFKEGGGGGRNVNAKSTKHDTLTFQGLCKIGTNTMLWCMIRAFEFVNSLLYCRLLNKKLIIKSLYLYLYLIRKMHKIYIIFLTNCNRMCVSLRN